MRERGPTGVYKPPFSPPSRGGKNISPLSEQGRKLAVFLKKNKRQMPEHKEEELDGDTRGENKPNQ